MKAPFRYALWSAGVILALLFVAAGILYLLYPKQKIIAAVVPRVEASLHRQVELQDAGISVWPPFGVYLQGVKVKNLPRFKEESLLEAGYARASIKLLPVFVGKLVFDEIELRDLTINYEVANADTSNVSDILAGEGKTPALLVQKFRLINATLRYADLAEKTSLELSGVDAQFEVDPADAAFDAKLALGAWKWEGDGESNAGTDAVDLQVHGTYDAATEHLEVDRLEGKLSSLPVTGTATVDLSRSPTGLAAHLKLGPSGLKSLLQQLPESRRQMLTGYELDGDLSGDLVWNGPIGGGGAWPLSGQIMWVRGRVAKSGVELSQFEGLTVPFDSLGFHVNGQNVRVLGGAMQLGLLATGLPPEKYELTASGTADLGRVAQLTDTPGMSGTVSYALSAAGRPEQLDTWWVKVHVEPRQVRFAQPGKAEFTLSSGAMDYDGQRLRLERIAAGSGRTKLAVSGSVDGLDLATLLSDSATVVPDADLSLTSTYLDLDGFFPDLAADTAQPTEQTTTPPAPPMRARATLAADTLIVGGAEWHHVRSKIAYADGKLTIDTLNGMVYGGAASMAGNVDLTNPALPVYHVTARADSVRIDGALSRFTSLAQHLRGRSNLKARVDGKGTELSDLLNDLTVDGSALLFDAGMVKLIPAAGVMGLLGLAPQDEIPLRSRSNAFRIEHGRVSFDDFRFTALGSQWNLAGSAGLDGSLDYSLGAVLSQELSSRVKLPDAATSGLNAEWLKQFNPVDLMKDDSGRVEVAFTLGGAYSKPQIGLDWDRMLPAMKSRFEARTTEQVKKKAEEGIKGLLDKFKR